MIGIGSPRASLESNFALRALVGAERFYAGIPESESRLLKLMLDVSAVARRALLRCARSKLPTRCSSSVRMSPTSRRDMALSLRQSVRQQPMQIAEKAAHPAVDGPLRPRGGTGTERAALYRRHVGDPTGRHRHTCDSRRAR